MSNKEDVQKFLEEFKTFAKVFDIFVIDTEKNIRSVCLSFHWAEFKINYPYEAK